MARWGLDGRHRQNLRLAHSNDASMEILGARGKGGQGVGVLAVVVIEGAELQAKLRQKKKVLRDWSSPRDKGQAANEEAGFESNAL